MRSQGLQVGDFVLQGPLPPGDRLQQPCFLLLLLCDSLPPCGDVLGRQLFSIVDTQAAPWGALVLGGAGAPGSRQPFPPGPSAHRLLPPASREATRRVCGRGGRAAPPGGLPAPRAWAWGPARSAPGAASPSWGERCPPGVSPLPSWERLCLLGNCPAARIQVPQAAWRSCSSGAHPASRAGLGSVL